MARKSGKLGEESRELMILSVDNGNSKKNSHK